MSHVNSTRRAQALLARRGVATLTVVMVLFFIMAMVAAYANRNLIFEQRTSANNYRSTQSMDAAEAGVEWAISMLNGGKIDANCRADAAGPSTFRARYLLIDPNTGGYTVPDPSTPACVMQDDSAGNGWTCSCPIAVAPVLPAPSDPPVSAYRVQFDKDPKAKAGLVGPGPPGFVRLTVRGCSNLGSGVEQCHLVSLDKFSNATAQVKVESFLGLVRALPTPPVATITAGGTVTVDPAVALRVSNGDAASAVTLHAGGAITTPPSVTLSGPAGTSGSATVVGDDAALKSLADTGRVFNASFGMDTITFQRQPAAVRVSCAAACSSADLAPVIAANPGRVIWVSGSLNLNTAGAVGTAAAPVMLMVDGDVNVQSAVAFVGFLYGQNITVGAGAAGASLQGAMVASGNVLVQGNADIAYDAKLLKAMSLSFGSFVRVPGSWTII